ncbi:CoA-binding protein [Candidatus Bathyarchaeota archaeon]|nr:CoA-binding protein [Candidatus Bathyarchaeota archaeon]
MLENVIEKLKPFFQPKSVAIIGASRNPTKSGYVVLENFVKFGYEGRVYPINPEADEILGVKAYPNVKDVPDEIDLAVIVLSAPAVPQVMRDCAEKHVKCAVIISGGFGEVGEEGMKREREVKEIIQKSGIRVIGPNCMGVVDTSTMVNTMFLPAKHFSKPERGNIGFISQSGAFGLTMIDYLASEGIGISKFASYGNKIDVSESELLEYFSQDPETKVILMYVEAIDNGQKFIEVAKKVTKLKPVVALKAGRTAAGSKAVISHTGALSGAYTIYKGAFSQAGIIHADNVQELVDIGKAFSYQPYAKGNRIAIITGGGGYGVIASDSCETLGLQVANLEDKTIENMRMSFPPHYVVKNPVDLTGDASEGDYKTALALTLEDKNVDGVIMIILFQVPRLEETIVDAISETTSRLHDKPVIVSSIGGEYTKKMVRKLEARKIPVYPTPERAVRAMAALVEYGTYVSKT